MVTDLYAVLGLPRDASKADIRKAYRTMAKQAHPDAGGDAEKFALIRLAHDVLTDDKRRDEYDRTGQYNETAVDNDLGNALQCVKTALDNVLNVISARGNDPVEYDILKDAKILAGQQIRQAEEMNAKHKDAVKKVRRVQARFKGRKKKPNLIASLFDQQIKTIEEAISRNEGEIKKWKRAIDIMNDHEFDWEAAMPEPPAPRLGWFQNLSLV